MAMAITCRRFLLVATLCVGLVAAPAASQTNCGEFLSKCMNALVRKNGAALSQVSDALKSNQPIDLTKLSLQGDECCGAAEKEGCRCDLRKSLDGVKAFSVPNFCVSGDGC